MINHSYYPSSLPRNLFFDESEGNQRRGTTIMASSSSSGLTFKLHLLVILNVSDHYIRVQSSLNLLLPTLPTVPIPLPYHLGFSVVSSAYRVAILSKSSTASSFSMIQLLTPSIALSSRRSRSSVSFYRP